MAGSKIKAKFAGLCKHCAMDIKKGDDATFFGKGEIYHPECRPIADDFQNWEDFQQSGYIFCDLETGGTKYWENPIIQIAGIATSDNFIIEDTFETLVKPDPEMIIHDEALAVNGLTRAQLEAAPEEKDAVLAFLQFCSKFKDYRFCGFYCSFDLGFLDYTYKKLDIRKLISVDYLLPALDIHRVAKKKLELESYKLVNVAGHFGYKSSAAHDALVDLFLTVQAARQLVQK